MNSYGRDMLLLYMLFLVNSLAVDIRGPIWPIFINSLGASMTELGIVFAISTAVGAVIQIPSGFLSDKYGRKKLHVIGTALAIIPPLMYALAAFWTDLIPWIVLSGIAVGLYLPIRGAIVADVSSSKTMASAYSRTNIAWLIGSTTAPFIGGLVADLFGIRFPFLLCFVLEFMVLPFVLVLRETGKNQQHLTPIEKQHQTITPYAYLSTLVWISIINMIQGIGMGTTSPIIPIFVTMNFQVDYTFLGILYAIGFGVASIVAQTPGAVLSNRFNRRKVMFVTFMVSAPFFLLFAYSRSAIELILFMFLSNVILNLHWTSYQTYIMDATPMSKWGFVNGISATTFWIGIMIGNSMSGFLWDMWGMLIPFYVSSIAIGFSALPLLLLKRARKI